MEEFASRLIYTLVCMGAEIIALGLQKIGRQAVVSITIIEIQSGTDCRHRNTHFDCRYYNAPPGGLGLFNGILKERIEQQIGQIGIIVECILDFA